MVSHPENGSDSPIGSDRDRGRDRLVVHHAPLLGPFVYYVPLQGLLIYYVPLHGFSFIVCLYRGLLSYFFMELLKFARVFLFRGIMSLNQ